MFKWIFRIVLIKLIFICLFSHRANASDPFQEDFSNLNITFNPMVSGGLLFNVSQEDQEVLPTASLCGNIINLGEFNKIRLLSPCLSYIGNINRMAVGAEVIGFEFGSGIGFGVPVSYEGELRTGFSLTFTFGGN